MDECRTANKAICDGEESCTVTTDCNFYFAFDYYCLDPLQDFGSASENHFVELFVPGGKSPNLRPRSVSCPISGTTINVLNAEIGSGLLVTNKRQEAIGLFNGQAFVNVNPSVLGSGTLRLEFECVCGAGYEVQPDLSTSLCTPCSIGSSRAASMVQCLTCAAGYFSGSTAAIECLPCQAGSYAEGRGNFECKLCPPGSISTSLGAIGPSSCVPVPANSSDGSLHSPHVAGTRAVWPQ